MYLENRKTKRGLDINFNFLPKVFVVLFLVVVIGTFWFFQDKKSPTMIDDQIQQRQIEKLRV
ncbi:hypothetical protein D7X33_49605 [Butyricicoccus sp. 1XD8-22]|nr:hypothetical protein D7X33_49605 [Butyricicoccus sp. 1XD8-22]